jgi:D-glycero-D-manno-heptose 1,7-bisphosphate phosphatase
MSRAAFLDRDGVINRKSAGSGYVTRWEDMDLLPGADKAISLLNSIGFGVIVVTNQRCVAKGLLTASQLEAMHSRMCDELAASGARIDGVYYCPHEKHPPCSCRKPRPGMLLVAAREHQIDLKASWMIGDSDNDVKAGRKVGCKTARILGTPASGNGKADVVASSLLEAIQQVLRYERMTSGRRIIPHHRSGRVESTGLDNTYLS